MEYGVIGAIIVAVLKLVVEVPNIDIELVTIQRQSLGGQIAQDLLKKRFLVIPKFALQVAGLIFIKMVVVVPQSVLVIIRKMVIMVVTVAQVGHLTPTTQQMAEEVIVVLGVVIQALLKVVTAVSIPIAPIPMPVFTQLLDQSPLPRRLKLMQEMGKLLSWYYLVT